MSQPGSVFHARQVSGHAKIALIGTQPIASSSGTQVQVEFNSVLYDDYGFWDKYNNRFVIPPNMGGLYEIMIQCTFESDPSGTRRIVIESGTTTLSSIQINPNQTNQTRTNCIFNGIFEPEDEFHADVLQNSGVTLDIIGAPPGGREITSMSILRVREM
jgi:hypothetical protein